MNSKSRILFLYKYLYNHTDDEHALTTQDLLRILSENGFQANRATLKKDVDLLIDSGYDIIAEREGKFNAYHYGAREFDYIQLQMLVDAVTSARFLSDKKSQELTERLSVFASTFQREKLEARIHATEYVRSDNPNVFIISDQITRAIDVNRMIEFQYYDYAGEKKKVLRNDGEIYRVSPYTLVWNDDRYYLLGFSDKRNKPVAFRVDRMCLPTILNQERYMDPKFTVEKYMNHVLRMFSGERCYVVLECEDKLMQNVIDQFGNEIPVENLSGSRFRTTVDVEISPPFFSWVFQFEGKIRIVSPEKVKMEYKDMLDKVLSAQEETPSV